MSRILVLGLLAFALLPGTPAAEAQDDMPDTFAPIRKDFLEALEAARPGRWIPLDRLDDLPRSVLFPVLQWGRLVFREGFRPERTDGGMSHAFQLAETGRFDLVRHEFEAAGPIGGRVVVTETVLVLHVAVHGRDPLDEDPLPRARALANALFQLGAEPAFEALPGSPGTFTSGREVHFSGMKGWEERIDVRIAGPDSIEFFCYKVGLEFEQRLPATRWFDAEFRGEAGGAVFLAARSGRTEALEPFAERADWTGRLAEAVLGRLQERALLDQAAGTDRRRVHEARAFLGIAAERAKDVPRAVEHYEAAMRERPTEETRLTRWLQGRIAELKR